MCACEPTMHGLNLSFQKRELIICQWKNRRNNQPLGVIVWDIELFYSFHILANNVEFHLWCEWVSGNHLIELLTRRTIVGLSLFHLAQLQVESTSPIHRLMYCD